MGSVSGKRTFYSLRYSSGSVHGAFYIQALSCARDPSPDHSVWGPSDIPELGIASEKPNESSMSSKRGINAPRVRVEPSTAVLLDGIMFIVIRAFSET